jgi:Icc-related predicted phosphoesterase
MADFDSFFLFLAGLSGWVIKLHDDCQNIPSGYLIGNKVSHIKVLKGKGLPFSFMVISDTHNSNVGETLLRVAKKEGDVSFLIHVGDFVNGPGVWDHRFFLMEMVSEIRPPFPVFLVPGNHDIDYASKIKQKEQSVTQEVFDSLYGARKFDFIFNDCLFILSEVDPKNPVDYLNYLREVLSKKGSGRKYIFVFIHYPPDRIVTYKGGSPLPNEAEFFNIVESYKVTTCFFGHYHGYQRVEVKGVQMVVLGGRGGRLKSWQPEWGKFHHLLKITVDENLVSERMRIVRGAVCNPIRTVKKSICVSLFPMIGSRNWILCTLGILFLALGVFSVIIVFCFYLRRRDIINVNRPKGKDERV